MLDQMYARGFALSVYEVVRIVVVLTNFALAFTTRLAPG
jgi:hypothetical protein